MQIYNMTKASALLTLFKLCFWTKLIDLCY